MIRLKSLYVIIISILLNSCINNKNTNEEKQIKETVAERPNIILIMADDQGWGDVGYNGHSYLKTPNLDKMAANGAQFNRFYAASAVCSPTRGSVMTGRHPLRYGICFANCGHVRSEEITLAEMVREQGYTTGHFGKWHLGTLTRDILDANRGGRPENNEHYAPPWEHGFDVSFVTESKVPTWNPMVTPSKLAEDVSNSLVEGEHFGTYYWTGPGQIETENLEGDDSRVIMDRAIPFIENATKNNQPFLTIIWFHTPHLPVLAGEDYKQKYSGLSEDQQHYYGVITALDDQVGRLRGKLRELGIADNTLLFYTSDNGPEGQSVSGRTQGLTKGLKGRKRSLYEGGIRVPGIMEWPEKIKPGTEVDVPCFTSDYFPTIANILNIDLKKYARPYDGINILPFAKGIVKERKEYLAFSFQQQVALIENEYKIYSSDGGNNFELYNILNDPLEEYNIASSNLKKTEDMVSLWKSWDVSRQSSELGNDYK